MDKNVNEQFSDLKPEVVYPPLNWHINVQFYTDMITWFGILNYGKGEPKNSLFSLSKISMKKKKKNENVSDG